MDAPEPRRRFNRVGIALAILIGLGTIPFTIQFQRSRVAPKTTGKYKTDYDIPLEKRQWRMHGLVDNTEKQTIERFGPPYIARNYNMSDGAFAGPTVGLKRFYPKTSPDYAARTRDAEAVWEFPEYAVIREVIWQLPDSYLTVWMREPRAEIDISDDKGGVSLPAAPEGGGDWVVIDNFRVGKDLVKTPPAASPPAGQATP